MRTVEKIQREIDQTQRRLESLMEELGLAPDLIEPPIGSVITFLVQYDSFGPAYKYEALRAHGKTWVVGRQTKNYNWEEIVTLICRDYSVSLGHRKATFQLATDWERR